MTKKIKITNLIPILKTGWVAMDANGNWCWYSHKPTISPVHAVWVPSAGDGRLLSAAFNIAKSDTDWDKSLIRVKNDD